MTGADFLPEGSCSPRRGAWSFIQMPASSVGTRS